MKTYTLEQLENLKISLKNVTISGDGSSRWGKSKEEYELQTALINYVDNETKDNSKYVEIIVKGKNTKWFQYTDNKIEKELKEILKEKFKEFGLNLVKFGWSEQGMQPEKGWSFDAYLKEIGRKSKYQSSMPKKPKFKKFPNLIGKKIKIGFIDGPPITGVVIPPNFKNSYRMMVKNPWRLLPVDSPEQIIEVEESVL